MHGRILNFETNIRYIIVKLNLRSNELHIEELKGNIKSLIQ